MPSPQQQVDGYLGPGWYTEWTQMDRQAADEERRFHDNKRRLAMSIVSPLYDRISSDLDTLRGVSEDYHRGLDLIVQGRRPAKDKVGTIHDFYTLAVGVMETENDLLDAMFWTGFVAAWVTFPFVLFEYQAQQLSTMIGKLKKILHEAEKEARNAKMKTAIHGVITVFETLVPELSVVTHVSVFLGEVVANRALGPSDATTFQKYEGIVTPGTKTVAETFHHVHEFSETTRDVAKQTGRVATAATFYFDVHEMSESSEKVEKIEKVMEEAKAAYDKLQRTIADNKPKLRQFLAAYDRWILAIDSIRETAANTRNALKADMAAARYDARRVYPWPMAL